MNRQPVAGEDHVGEATHGDRRVRPVEIAGCDVQPCGGTHVRRTGGIGAVRVAQVEKKGKHNRRVRIAFGQFQARLPCGCTLATLT